MRIQYAKKNSIQIEVLQGVNAETQKKREEEREKRRRRKLAQRQAAAAAAAAASGAAAAAGQIGVSGFYLRICYFLFPYNNKSRQHPNLGLTITRFVQHVLSFEDTTYRTVDRYSCVSGAPIT